MALDPLNSRIVQLYLHQSLLLSLSTAELSLSSANPVVKLRQPHGGKPKPPRPMSMPPGRPAAAPSPKAQRPNPKPSRPPGVPHVGGCDYILLPCCGCDSCVYFLAMWIDMGATMQQVNGFWLLSWRHAFTTANDLSSSVSALTILPPLSPLTEASPRETQGSRQTETT